MESKALVQALKTAVREVIKEELADILREGLQSTVTELQTETTQPVNNGGVSKPKKRKSTMYTRNKFADVLNETDGLREMGVPAYADLMKEDMSFTANDAQGFGMMRNNAAPQIMEDPETGKNMKVDPLILDVMNRDYRGLMKAIDKKKGK
jgi:hypothetical protein